MSFYFDKVIELYDYARPCYPLQLYQDIIEYSKVDNNSKILEVGAGTGQSTSYWVKNNYCITALEITDMQVEYLTHKYRQMSNFNVIKSKFEEFYTETSYDLLIAASSFHWIDSRIRYIKAGQVLRCGGTLAQYWHMTPVQKVPKNACNGLQEIFEQYFPEVKFYDLFELKNLTRKRVGQLKKNTFVDIVFREYFYIQRYTLEQYISLLATYSYVIKSENRDSFLYNVSKCIEKNDGIIEIPITIHLYLARTNRR